MKIKTNVKILDPMGKTIKRNGEELTLQKVMENALLLPVEKDTDSVKWEKYELWKRVKKAKDIVELSTKEASAIKTYIGLHEPQLIMGQAWELIEGSDDKE